MNRDGGMDWSGLETRRREIISKFNVIVTNEPVNLFLLLATFALNAIKAATRPGPLGSLNSRKAPTSGSSASERSPFVADWSPKSGSMKSDKKVRPKLVVSAHSFLVAILEWLNFLAKLAVIYSHTTEKVGSSELSSASGISTKDRK